MCFYGLYILKYNNTQHSVTYVLYNIYYLLRLCVCLLNKYFYFNFKFIENTGCINEYIGNIIKLPHFRYCACRN